MILPLFFLSPLVLAHDGHSDRAPWEVCAQQVLSDGCSWENGAHELYRGSCREVGGSLLCVRNQPVVSAPVAPSGRFGWWVVAFLPVGAAAAMSWRWRSPPAG